MSFCLGLEIKSNPKTRLRRLTILVVLYAKKLIDNMFQDLSPTIYQSSHQAQEPITQGARLRKVPLLSREPQPILLARHILPAKIQARVFVALGVTMRHQQLERRLFQNEVINRHLLSRWIEDEALPKQTAVSRPE
jgi:hypothetical protein